MSVHHISISSISWSRRPRPLSSVTRSTVFMLLLTNSVTLLSDSYEAGLLGLCTLTGVQKTQRNFGGYFMTLVRKRVDILNSLAGSWDCRYWRIWKWTTLTTTKLKNRLWKVLRSNLLQESVHYWPHQFMNHAPSDTKIPQTSAKLKKAYIFKLVEKYFQSYQKNLVVRDKE